MAVPLDSRGIKNPYPNQIHYDSNLWQAHLVVYDTKGEPLGGVVHPLEWTYRDERNAIPTLEVKWTRHEESHLLLQRAAYIAIEQSIAYEGENDDRPTWTEVRNSRFYITDMSMDRRDVTGTVTTRALGMAGLLDHAHVWNINLNEESGKRKFTDTTAGNIIVTLLEEARSRGELQQVSVGFTPQADSFGNGWTRITREYEPSTSLKDVLLGLSESGLVDFWMHGNTLHVCEPGEWERRFGDDEYRAYIRSGVTPSEPETHTWDRGISRVLVIGEKGFTYDQPGDGAGGNPYGGRGAVVQAGGISTAEDARRFARRTLQENKAGQGISYSRELTYIDDRRTQCVPGRDFSTGDTIFIDCDAGRRQPVVVQDMTIKRTNENTYQFSMTAGDLLSDAISFMLKRQAALSESADIAATGAPRKPVLINTHPNQRFKGMIASDKIGLTTYGKKGLANLRINPGSGRVTGGWQTRKPATFIDDNGKEFTHDEVDIPGFEIAEHDVTLPGKSDYARDGYTPGVSSTETICRTSLAGVFRSQNYGNPLKLYKPPPYIEVDDMRLPLSDGARNPANTTGMYFRSSGIDRKMKPVEESPAVTFTPGSGASDRDDNGRLVATTDPFLGLWSGGLSMTPSPKSGTRLQMLDRSITMQVAANKGKGTNATLDTGPVRYYPGATHRLTENKVQMLASMGMLDDPHGDNDADQTLIYRNEYGNTSMKPAMPRAYVNAQVQTAGMVSAGMGVNNSRRAGYGKKGGADIEFLYNDFVGSSVSISTDKNFYIRELPTTTSATQQMMLDKSNKVCLTSSSERYKLEREAVTEEAARAMLDVSPVTWIDKTAADQGKERGEVVTDRDVGYTVEDVARVSDAHGGVLEPVIIRDADGTPTSLAYERMPDAYTLVLLKTIIDKQDSLERRISALEERLES